MSQSISIRAHFDGKAIVPDEPVELKANDSLIIDIHRVSNETPVKKDPSQFTPEEQLAALRELLTLMKDNPDIPLEATRRINMYEDSKY